MLVISCLKKTPEGKLATPLQISPLRHPVKKRRWLRQLPPPPLFKWSCKCTVRGTREAVVAVATACYLASSICKNRGVKVLFSENCCFCINLNTNESSERTHKSPLFVARFFFHRGQVLALSAFFPVVCVVLMLYLKATFLKILIILRSF